LVAQFQHFVDLLILPDLIDGLVIDSSGWILSLTVHMSNCPSHMQQARLFQSERLERFTRISLAGFLTTWLLALPLAVAVGWNTSTPPVEALGLVAAGFVFWLPVEYVLHRYLFHWKPSNPALRRFVFIMHGNHHDTPNDPLRNLMPPIVTVPVGVVLWTIAVFLLDPWGIWTFLGFGIGYVIYDLSHYACHQMPMNGRLGQMLKRHHMRHHHIDEAANYAITVPVLDWLFGTRIESLKKVE
jgi:sterol desaturase/sphingolipid hydroxylase (fatty acid hydroxylase superfamily)